MSNFVPYLSFNGNCREAVDFYKEAFSADNVDIMLIKDDEGAKSAMPAEFHDNIMHAALQLGSTSIYMADSMDPSIFAQGTAFSVAFVPDSEEQTKTVFENLSVGGNVTMPLAETSWAKLFGMLDDKFGVTWLISFS